MTPTIELLTPAAPVLRWNARHVDLKCPYCEKIHHHGFSGYSHNRRVPHCSYGVDRVCVLPSYRFEFPYSTDSGAVGYEIDKDSGYYVALGAKVPEFEVEELGNTLSGLNIDTKATGKCKSWEEATEMVTVGLEDDFFRALHQTFGGDDDETLTMKRTQHLFNRMLMFGDAEYVQRYLRESPEAELFLHGVDKEGKSALNLAACERHSDIVALLLEHGADPNHQDDDGRTALMQASLWGRINNVTHLLQHGADRQLRDSDGRLAADFAMPSSRNEQERHETFGGGAQSDRENGFLANQDRSVILALLKGSEQSPCGGPSKRTPTNDAHVFQKVGRRTIQLLAPIAEFHVKNEKKTIAYLQRPGNCPAVAAMSGWAHGCESGTISGRQWTAEVMELSRIVGHKLSADYERDQGIKGQFSASHAEKQLIAYFVEKHVLWTTDDEILKDAIPPVLLKEVTVLVSQDCCPDCTRFIGAVNRRLGLSITVQAC